MATRMMSASCSLIFLSILGMIRMYGKVNNRVFGYRELRVSVASTLG